MYILIIFAICAFLGLLCGIFDAKKGTREHETGTETVTDNRGDEEPEPAFGDGPFLILGRALRSLQKQHAGGYRNWISACMEKMQGGYDVPLPVALRALYFTRNELTGSRFNLDGLNMAIVELEEQMGVWD